MKNWKTSLFGIGCIIAGVVHIFQGDLPKAGEMIAAGLIGILSKDHDVKN